MDDRRPYRGALEGRLIIAAVRNRCGVSSDKREKRADARGRTSPPGRASSLSCQLHRFVRRLCQKASRLTRSPEFPMRMPGERVLRPLR